MSASAWTAPLLFGACSFVASVAQGSISLGDGIVMHVLWGILTTLWPALLATTSTAAEGDGTAATGGAFHVVTMLLYLRLVTMPPYLMWLLMPKRAPTATPTLAGTPSSPTPPASSPDPLDPASPNAWTPNGIMGLSAPSSPVPSRRSSMAAAQPPALSTASTRAPATSSGPFGAFDTTTFVVMAVPAAFWAVAGVYVLQAADTALIEVCFGVLCIGFAVLYLALRKYKSVMRHRLAAQRRRILEGRDGDGSRRPTVAIKLPALLAAIVHPPPYIDPDTRRPRTLAAVAVSFSAFVGGLMSSLGGIGGPPMMLAVLLLELPPPLVRMTFPLGYAAPSYLRIVVAWYVGLLDAREWRLYVPALVLGLVGLHVGVALGNFLTPNTFSLFVFCLLTLAGTVMLTEAPWVLLPAFAVCIATVAASHVLEQRKLNNPPATTQEKGGGGAGSPAGASAVVPMGAPYEPYAITSRSLCFQTDDNDVVLASASVNSSSSLRWVGGVEDRRLYDELCHEVAL